MRYILFIFLTLSSVAVLADESKLPCDEREARAFLPSNPNYKVPPFVRCLKDWKNFSNGNYTPVCFNKTHAYRLNSNHKFFIIEFNLNRTPVPCEEHDLVIPGHGEIPS